MTDIGELVVRIKADAAQLEREMRKAQGTVQNAAGGMGSAFSTLKTQILSLAPAISAVAFVEFGRRAIDAAGHMVDLADRVGFAAGTLAALEIPLNATGTSLDEFTSAVTRMNNAIGEARKGNEATIKAFDALGLSVDKLATLSPEDQFYAIAGALGQIKDQSVQTEAGMNIFGRTFAAMLPLLKQYEGDMRKAVEAQQELNNGLSSETLKRVDEFGDSLSAAGIRVKNEFIEAFAAILCVVDAVDEFAKKHPIFVKPATNAKSSLPGENPKYGPNMPKGIASSAKPKSVDYAVFVGGEQYGPQQKSTDATGSNKDLLDRIQAMKDAAKATNDISKATEELTEAQKDAIRFQGIMHDRLSASLTDIAFKAGSARDAMLGFAESIARAVFERKIAGPLADALIGSAGGKGLIDSILPSFGGYFAEGGRPPVGIPSVVGENGPEIFVPNSAGTIIPNGVGGKSVIVQQTINLSPGLAETINAAVMNAAPHIAAAAQASVFAELQRGGAGSRIAGLRS